MLVEALPYIKRFHGQKIVIKVGGVAIEQRKQETLLDIVLLRYVGMLPVLVHGGGAEITSMSDRLGLKAEFKRGLRVTDAQTMEVVKMVLTGKINPDLVAALNRLGGQAVGMSGEDGPRVNAEPIDALINRGYIPVMASIGLGYDGHAYNINADTVAAELAVALGASKLILMTDVEGVKDSNGQVISELGRARAEEMIGSGVADGGMIPKLEAAVRSLDAVPYAHIVDGRMPHALLLELFTEAGIGTMVTP